MDGFAVFVVEYGINKKKVEPSYLQKMNTVSVANVMQVLRTMNVTHFPIMLSTELRLCVVLFLS